MENITRIATPQEAHDKFTAELMQSVGKFLGIPPIATTSILSELLPCLEMEVIILERFNEQPDSQMFVDALDCLQSACEKLSKGRLLRSYIGRIAGTVSEDGVETRRTLLGELHALLQKSQKKMRRF